MEKIYLVVNIVTHKPVLVTGKLSDAQRKICENNNNFTLVTLDEDAQEQMDRMVF